MVFLSRDCDYGYRETGRSVSGPVHNHGQRKSTLGWHVRPSDHHHDQEIRLRDLAPHFGNHSSAMALFYHEIQEFLVYERDKLLKVGSSDDEDGATIMMYLFRGRDGLKEMVPDNSI